MNRIERELARNHYGPVVREWDDETLTGVMATHHGSGTMWNTMVVEALRRGIAVLSEVDLPVSVTP